MAPVLAFGSKPSKKRDDTLPPMTRSVVNKLAAIERYDTECARHVVELIEDLYREYGLSFDDGGKAGA